MLPIFFNVGQPESLGTIFPTWSSSALLENGLFFSVLIQPHKTMQQLTQDIY